MAKKVVNQDLRVVDGWTLWTPGNDQTADPYNLKVPDPNNDIDTIQQYPIGTRLTRGDRAWRYALVGNVDGMSQTTNIRRGMGMLSMAVVNVYTTTTILTESGYNTDGDTKLKLNMSTHVDATQTASAVGLNDYQNGFLTIYDGSSGNYWGCAIESNTAEDASGYVYLTLESELPFSLSQSGDYVMVHESPYWKVQPSGSGNAAGYVGNFGTICGFPGPYNQYKTASSGTDIADSKYIWLQTWGPYPGIIMGRAYHGAEAERYQAMSGTGYPNENTDFHGQTCGYYIPCTGDGDGTGTDADYNNLGAFFLQICW